jgi:hypothetical protein
MAHLNVPSFQVVRQGITGGNAVEGGVVGNKVTRNATATSRRTADTSLRHGAGARPLIDDHHHHVAEKAYFQYAKTYQPGDQQPPNHNNRPVRPNHYHATEYSYGVSEYGRSMNTIVFTISPEHHVRSSGRHAVAVIASVTALIVATPAHRRSLPPSALFHHVMKLRQYAIVCFQPRQHTRH